MPRARGVGSAKKASLLPAGGGMFIDVVVEAPRQVLAEKSAAATEAVLPGCAPLPSSGRALPSKRP